ncbi:CDP-diacylglycerol--glycerol-3-phosphate 3-phosphatidyltransferase 1, chloroplastic-like [Phalaenopsis equestris]|uniref:CDP-diacylglycerol--glycerol-3-phosphate 3-phosphatidyltransferase 1, chloroplastic-like n=1 Tax=Phalaenopsis equestris TaxID=78828 RepID=UPI0009E42515|nr:CDP-diacylglycerol--glycerol-3-phosphate 3-phosphatidyltransferase 1, chloroplastic-like [Phalaenopsis equestris]
MPSHLSAAVFRAISSPFLHPKNDPSHFLHRSVRRAADAGFRRIALPTSPITFAMYRRRAERNGAVRSTGGSWSAGICSSGSSFEAGEGKWADGGVTEDGRRGGRGQEMDSRLHHRCGTNEVGEDMDGGYNQLLQQEQRISYSRLLTLPTVLTLGRVAAVPLLVTTYHMSGSWATTTTTGIFLVAAFTDWLDGYLARKMQLGTTFGAFLDPVADKLMVAATLVLLCSKPLEVAFFGVVPWILTVPAIAIIGREITMSAVREWAAAQNNGVLEAVAVNNLGKWKTATQMTALTILLLSRDPSLTGPGILVSTGVFLLYVSAGLALWSLAVYMRKIWRFLIK